MSRGAGSIAGNPVFGLAQAMARPPLPIAGSSFTRPINDWINLVNQKKTELESLLEARALEKEAAVWMESEFSRIALAGIETTERSSSIAEAGVIASLLEIKGAIASHGKHAPLTPDLLLRVNDLLSGASATSAAWAGMRAERSIAMACDWFSADSFNELHATEQAATVLIRLSEIQAFERVNHLTSVIGASLFTMRAGLPPTMIPPETEASLQSAIAEAKRMNTRPMVELIARTTEIALGSLIKVLRTTRR